MSKLFSERNGIRAKIVHPEQMPEGVRNRVWNLIEHTIDNTRVNNRKNGLIKKLWSDFFKKPNSELHGVTSCY